MSSSPSSSSPSSSPSSPDGRNGDNVIRDPGPSTRRRRRRPPHHLEAGPSSSSRSRQRAMNEVWPEHFLEDLASQVAFEASRSHGRLAAAPAIANLFQDCSTWRAISRSDLLWQRLTGRIWRLGHRLRATWHDEFIYWHRTARNFATGRYVYTTLHYHLSPPSLIDPHAQLCRCLTLSDHHLACGFADGSVSLFDLESRAHVSTFQSHHDYILGPFSRSVSGIVITNSMLAFATLDGNIYVALINGQSVAHIVQSGDILNNGVLMEFAGGGGRWWVGLFAGAEGQAFRVWDSHSNQPVYIGGSLTDQESVQGWRMLTDITEPVGRLRITTNEMAVACTRSRLIVFDLRNPGTVLRELVSNVGFIVSSLDVSHNAFVIVDRRGRARVRRVNTLEPLCEFMVAGVTLRGLIGCMNSGYALLCAGGYVRVWDVERPGGHLRLTLAERLGMGMAMAASERHVAISCRDTLVHLWDFGVQ